MMFGITLQTWWVQVNDEPGPELILSMDLVGPSQWCSELLYKSLSMMSQVRN